MPVAVSVATRSGLSTGAVAELARAAERAGVDAFFVAESAADSFVQCQAALAATETIPVGTAIANARLRHPVATAMAAAALDELSGGRFRLGLGVSNAAYNEGALGMPPVRPVEFMRQYLLDVRRALAGGVPVDRVARDPQLSIALAAMQPRMLRLAGALADGVVLSLTTEQTLPVVLGEVAAGADGENRTIDDLEVSCVLPCCFGTDSASALRAGRNVVLNYARHPAAARIFAAHGFADRLPGVLAALADDDRAVAHRLIDDDLVLAFALVDPAQAVDRIAAYRAAGVDLPILFPVPADDDWDAAVRRAVELVPLLDPVPNQRRVLT